MYAPLSKFYIMTNRIITLLLIVSSLFLTSCFEIVEEVFLNKDGSGSLKTHVDLGDIFNNPFMKGALEEEMAKEGTTAQDMEMDSIIYYKDAPEGTFTAEEKKLIEQANMHLIMSQSTGKFSVTTTLPFASLDDLPEIQKIIAKAAADSPEAQSNPMLEMLQGTGFGNETPLFSLKKRQFTRTTPEDTAADNEDLAMMEMFLADATIKTIYHMPGKIKETTIANAVIDGKTVTVTNDLLDIIKKKVNVDGDICFKRR